MNWLSHLISLCKNFPVADCWIASPLMIRDQEIRAYFKRPKIVFKHGWIDTVNSFFVPLFGFCVKELEWKDKENEPRFEDSPWYISHPYIQVNLFGYALIWEFTCPCSDDEIGVEDAYWESMMDYYNMLCKSHKDSNLYRIITEHTWTDINGVPFNTTSILTDDGLHKYLEDKLSYEQDKL